MLNNFLPKRTFPHSVNAPWVLAQQSMQISMRFTSRNLGDFRKEPLRMSFGLPYTPLADMVEERFENFQLPKPLMPINNILIDIFHLHKQLASMSIAESNVDTKQHWFSSSIELSYRYRIRVQIDMKCTAINVFLPY